MNGYLAEENVSSVADILPWLREAIAHCYPTSTYASALDTDMRERAARRVFSPPRIGAQVFCRHSGGPNPAPGMDKVFIFYCARCGNSIEVEEPKIN
jgi:hypothetical protein